MSVASSHLAHRLIWSLILAATLAVPLIPTSLAYPKPGIYDADNDFGPENYYDIYMLTRTGEGPFLEGNLTWSGSNKGISWESDAPSSDNMPAEAEDTQAAKTFVVSRCMSDPNCSPGWPVPPSNTYSVTNGMTLQPAPRAPNEFVSQVLPRDMYVDVRRGIDFFLYIKEHPSDVNDGGGQHTPCSQKWGSVSVTVPVVGIAPGVGSTTWYEPYWEIELLADGQRIAFGVPPTAWIHDGAPGAVGYGVCNYHMAPEVQFLKKGTVLTLRINHVLEQYTYSMGFAGNHRSALRIAEYSTEDLVLRRPDLIQPADDGAGTNTGGGTGLAAIALLLAAPLAVPRRNAKGTIALLLVVLLAVSGCLGGAGKGKPGGEPTVSGTATVTFVPLRTNEIFGNGTGSIYGLVQDDLNITIPDVFVTLQGTPNSTQTDAKGQFKFLGILPGTYTLRFDHKEYLMFQTPVEVRLGLASGPRVTLFLKNPVERDARPHAHPYVWGADTSKVLASNLVLPSRCPSSGTEPCQPPKQVFTTIPNGDDPRIVLPGTQEIEVKLHWDVNALGLPKLGLSVFPPALNAYWDLHIYAPRGPDEPFRIQTTWDGTDNGHAKYSNYHYYWYVPMSGWTNEAYRANMEAGHDPGAVTVSVRIIKGGSFPLEPAHPDFWNGADIIDGGGRKLEFDFSTNPNQDVPCPIGGLIGPDTCYHFPYRAFSPNHVPAETKLVKVVVTQSRAASPTAFGWMFWMKDGTVPPMFADDDTLAGFRQVTNVAQDNLQYSFSFPVTAKTSDGVYHGGSAWRFAVRATDEQAAWADQQAWSATGEMDPPVGSPRLSLTFAVSYLRNP